MPINVNFYPNGASGGDVRGGFCERSHQVPKRTKEGQVRAGEPDQLEGSPSKKWLTIQTTRFQGLWVALD